MGLSDFEKELTSTKGDGAKLNTRDEDRERKHRHHHRSHRHRDESRDEEDRHRRKRRRDREGDDEPRHGKRRRSDPPKPEKKAVDVKVFDSDGGEDDWVEKEDAAAVPEEETMGDEDVEVQGSKVKRDAWMQESAALDIDYVQSRKPKEPQGQFVSAKHGNDFKMPEPEASKPAADLERDFDSDGDDDLNTEKIQDEEAQHDVSYTFGDSASSWRMTKLKAVHRQVEETGRSVDDVALERYGDLRDFDDAREEEREMDRRKMYGKAYVGLEKPSGELFQERKMQAGLRREAEQHEEAQRVKTLPQAELLPEAPAPATTAPLDQTALNKLKAQSMKAKLRNAPNAAQLEAEYNLAASASQTTPAQPDIVVLSEMHHPHLAGSRFGEVTPLTTKRGLARGLVTENADMSLEDMVKHEKRTRGAPGGGDGKAFAERIAKDGRFKADLEYMDDNAASLAKTVLKSDVNLRSTAIGDYQKLQRALDACPLCHHEDTGQPPIAPVVSLATRTFLTLPPEPEVVAGGAVIVPLQHRRNLLECDEDEWEEVRNFMKSLTRYYAARDRAVLFYENAAHMLSSHNNHHAAMFAVPLPHHLAATAPAYFREAILSADEQWAQHKPLIDTLALSRTAGGGGDWLFGRAW
ncbi:hypothetical protein LTR08_008933 [Meristemomyces frigidus]|nr:hypothetical protein LTR08_008933 [Meristemomyces frigidus]